MSALRSEHAPQPRPTTAPAHLAQLRVRLAPDGACTTVYVARYPLVDFKLRVVRLRRPAPLEAWCAQHHVAEAMVGGFYVRPDGMPLGELRTRGLVRRHAPFAPPYGDQRACVHADRGVIRIAPRTEIGAHPRGDLLQAGPLLVARGWPVARDGADAEGFSEGSHQFDSDITAGRYPRAALGVGDTDLIALACDGRADDDAGLTIGELADVMATLGAHEALNLDGGGSTSLVCEGSLRNVPREHHGHPLPGGRPVSTALVFRRRTSR